MNNFQFHNFPCVLLVKKLWIYNQLKLEGIILIVKYTNVVVLFNLGTAYQTHFATISSCVYVRKVWQNTKVVFES